VSALLGGLQTCSPSSSSCSVRSEMPACDVPPVMQQPGEPPTSLLHASQNHELLMTQEAGSLSFHHQKVNFLKLASSGEASHQVWTMLGFSKRTGEYEVITRTSTPSPVCRQGDYKQQQT
ncbi:hypothetical protein STEG23_022251, partial [Scotinomys teguina]